MVDQMIFLLTLIAMRGDTFHSLSFLDQILSAEFVSKISKKNSEVEMVIDPVKVTPCQTH